MISINVLFLIMFMHFVADFIFQSDRIAHNKSTNNWILLQHVILYSIPFAIAFGWLYGIITLALHFCVDFVTSRITKRLWEAKETHWFFVTIGFDQFLHFVSLVWLYVLLDLPK